MRETPEEEVRKAEYRIKVYRLMTEVHPDKYPSFNEFMKMERRKGGAEVIITILLLAQFLDTRFNMNLTISAAADEVEKMNVRGKSEAERLFMEAVADDSVKH